MVTHIDEDLTYQFIVMNEAIVNDYSIEMWNEMINNGTKKGK